MQWSWPQECVNLLLLNFMRRQKFEGTCDVTQFSTSVTQRLAPRTQKKIRSCCIMIPRQCNRGYFNMIKLSYNTTDQIFVHHGFFFNFSFLNVFWYHHKAWRIILFEYLLRLKNAIPISRDHLSKVKNFSPISKMDTWYTLSGREWFCI